jgi:hypothetical protein
MNKKFLFVASICATILVSGPVFAKKKTKTPAEGFNIHIVAPHRHEDGTVHGPYHHYC